MSMALPWTLTVLAGVTLALAVVALWQSLRAAFGASQAEAGAAGISGDRADLVEEKTALLRSIRDLDLDREADKIADEDFERLDGRLRSRARDVLRLLDEDVQAFRPAAEALVARALGTPAEPQSPTAPAPALPASLTPASACAGCGTVNDADASFCKRCGARLGAGEEEDAP
jgi:hypothetical protein